MSEPIASQSEEFSAFRQEFIAWKRIQTHCRFMLSASLEDYVGKKTAEAWRQKYGKKRMDEYFEAIKKGVQENFFRLSGLDKRFENFHGIKRERAIEFYWIKCSTEAARQLKRLKLLGLDDSLKKGDEEGFLLAAMRAKPLRDNPKKAASLEGRLVDWAGKVRENYALAVEMDKIRKQPPIDFSQFKMDKVEEHLLRLWDAPWYDKAGQLMPPLCYFTDKPLERAVQIAFKGDTHTPASLRKKWIRLGLLRAKTDRIVGLRIKPS